MNTEGKVITFEEHYVCPGLVDLCYDHAEENASPLEKQRLEAGRQFVKTSPLTDVGKKRLAWMDEKGVDIQVLIYGDNAPQDLPASLAVDACRKANDWLAEQISRHPDRFVGFATLPVDDPEAAAEELERCVKSLGFRGAGMKATYAGKEFMDEPRFEPIWAKAEELGVPVILHPTDVKADVSKEYYQGGNIDPIISIMLSGSAIGWHYETGIAYLRLVVSGLLDRHPNLKLIMGHWGEMIPYYFDRLDMVLGNLAKGKLEHNVSDYFRKMYVMPSGMIPADEDAKPEIDTDFRTCLDYFGEDHILWGNDYPYRIDAPMPQIRNYIEGLPLSDEAKAKIMNENGARLLRL